MRTRLTRTAFVLAAVSAGCSSEFRDSSAGDGGSTMDGGGGVSGGGVGGSGAQIAGGGATAGGGGTGGSSLPDGPLTVADGLTHPTGLAVGLDRVFIATLDDGGIVACPLAGCEDTPQQLASGRSAPVALGLSETHLYWVESLPARSVYRCALPACDAASIEPFDSGSHEPYSVRILSGRVYLPAWPSIASCAETGCGTDEVLLGQGPAVSIDQSGSTLVVALYGWQTVRTCTDTCPGDVLLDGVTPLSVAVDETSVYVADHNYYELSAAADTGPRIVRCPIEGCGEAGPEVVAPDAVAPFALETHDGRLYYTDYEAGTVVSLPTR